MTQKASLRPDHRKSHSKHLCGEERYCMTDLTKGSPLRQIFLFSLPFLIGNVFQQFYNIADMVIVGRILGPEAYTAVGATSSLVWFASGAIQSLTIGFSVIAAQHFGSHDEEGVKRAFGASIWLSAVISVTMAVLCAIFARPILMLLQTPADIIDRSYRYIVWIFMGLVATALFNLLSNMIRSLGDSRTPLYFLVIACVINIILDIVLIAFYKMDTDGAGLATVLAQLLSGLLCIIYIKWKQPFLHVSRKDLKWDSEMNVRLLKVGIPMAFLNMVLSVGSIVMQFVTNGLGTQYVTAHTTGAKVENFVTLPILSFGSAISVFAAQNYGAGKCSRVIEGGKKTLWICFWWSVIASAIMLPCGRFVISLLAGDVPNAVVNNAYLYIVVNTLLTFVLSPLVIFKSVLQAVCRTTFTMISGFTEVVGRAGLSVCVLFFMNGMHLFGVETGFFIMCFASPLAWLLGLLTVLFDYIGMVRKFRRKADHS